MIQFQDMLAGLLFASTMFSVTVLAVPIDTLDDPTAPDCSMTGSSLRYQPLMCWLYNAQLSLPDESFQEEIFTVVRCLYLVCWIYIGCVTVLILPFAHLFECISAHLLFNLYS